MYRKGKDATTSRSGQNGRKKRVRADDGRVRRAAAQRQERRAEVLAAARHVFSTHGYHAASIAHIIDAAGIARGTFYLYFVSKRAIFDELLDDFFALMTREVRVVDVSPGAPPPREQLTAIVKHVLQTLLANADLTRILLRETGGPGDEFDRRRSEFLGRLLGLIKHALETGIELGLCRPGDTLLRAHMTLGTVKELVDGLLTMAEQGQLVDVDAATREALDFNLNGLLRSS
jgi:AcrR family transcriptional regulator